MTAMRALPTIAAITLLVACTDPRFDVKIAYDPLVTQAITEAEDAAALAGNDAKRLKVQVSVIDAAAAATTADGDEAAASCKDFAFGRIDASVIDGARRASASAPAGDDTHLSAVPRLGPKLVIVEVLNPAGRRVAVGCADVDDVTDDADVPVQVHVAPTVLVFDRQESTEVAPVTLVAVAPWDPTLLVGGNQVITELHGGGATVSNDEDEDDGVRLPEFGADGQYTTPLLALPAPTPEGPVLTLVRVQWAEEVIRLPAFVPWKAIQTTTGARITVGPDATQAYDRAWTTPTLVGTRLYVRDRKNLAAFEMGQ